MANIIKLKDGNLQKVKVIKDLTLGFSDVDINIIDDQIEENFLNFAVGGDGKILYLSKNKLIYDN